MACEVRGVRPLHTLVYNIIYCIYLPRPRTANGASFAMRLPRASNSPSLNQRCWRLLADSILTGTNPAAAPWSTDAHNGLLASKFHEAVRLGGEARR